MQEELMTAIVGALGTILVALIGYIAQKVANYLKEKGLAETLENKWYLVEIVVKAVEQVYQNEDGETKFQKAKEEILRMLANNGLSMTEHELDSFIEAAVREMNEALEIIRTDDEVEEVREIPDDELRNHIL